MSGFRSRRPLESVVCPDRPSADWCSEADCVSLGWPVASSCIVVTLRSSNLIPPDDLLSEPIGQRLPTLAGIPAELH